AEELPSRPQNWALSVETTLLTDGIPQGGRQLARVDNRVLHSVPTFLGLNVQLAGSMATLAADRVAAKDGLLIAIDCACDRFHLIGRAKQAKRFGWPLELLTDLNRRRHIPDPRLRVPTGRHLQD